MQKVKEHLKALGSPLVFKIKKQQRKSTLLLLYRWPGSNRHVHNEHWILSPARLPIPPHRQYKMALTAKRRWSDLNRRSGFCRPTPYHLATPPPSNWATRIRTWGMTGPKPVALPLGYSPKIILSKYPDNRDSRD